ncbi:MAG: hypothetical protein AB7L13_12650 [Acidimicrobiia bacterium]
MASPALSAETAPSERHDRHAHSLRWTPTVGSLVGLGFAVWALRIGLRPIGDNSFLTHLATGRLIVADGVPHRDPYTFTALGHTWVVQSWLASLVYGLLDRWWGSRALQLFTGAVATALGAVLWRLTRPIDGLLVRMATMLAVIVISTDFWSERPLLLGLLGLALVMTAVQGGSAPWWLVPVAWFWTNVHGSFPLGALAIVAFAIGRRLDGEHPAIELRALALFVAGVLAGVVNPFGPRLLTFPIALLRRSDELKFIVEWGAPRFDSTPQRAFLLLFFVAILTLVRRRSWRTAIPVLVFAGLALTSMRNIPVAATVFIAAMSPALAGIGSLKTATRMRPAPVMAAAIAVLGGLVVVAAFEEPAFGVRSYPIGALNWLDDRGLLDGNHRVITRDYVGNYLEAAYGPTGSVFVDDRVEVVEPAVLEDHKTLLFGTPGWADVLRSRQADAVLWTRASPLTRALEIDERWHVVYVDHEWVVALPR